MKRMISGLLAVCMLATLTGCGCKGNNSYVPLEPLTYTELPRELKAEKIGTIQRETVKTAAGGLYYEEEDKFGILTLDGKLDTGAIYAVCQPKGRYFLVSETEPEISSEVTKANVMGLVDGTGRILVPMEYASVELLGNGDRFVRVAELTGTTTNEEEHLTQITVDDEALLCTGKWYIYDLKTGKKVEGAEGSKPYINFDCGGYLKYVTDDKETITCTPDGKVIPNDVVHLKNGHYADAKEKAVYDSDGNWLFTYDADGYIPVDSEGVSGYILAEKKEKEKTTYVYLDLTGEVASAVFDRKPTKYGELYLVGSNLVTLEGKVVVEGCALVFWEPIYGQSWAVYCADSQKIVDRHGETIFESKSEDVMLDQNRMMCCKKADSSLMYCSAKDQKYTIKGIGVAPFVVKSPNGSTNYDLINVLNGEALLEGYSNYTIADADKTLVYVYAQTKEGTLDVFVLR